MLTIQNIENLNNANFSCGGHKWILYAVDVNNIEYKFIFIPMDYQTKVFELSGAQLVILDRNKKRIGNEVLGYRLWTTDGRHTYIHKNDIPLWTRLVGIVYKNKMICSQ